MVRGIDLQVGFRKKDKEVTLIKKLNFDVQPTQIWAIIGRNGTGKTTLLRSIIGLHPLLNGEVLVDDKPIKDHSANEIARKLAIVTTERINLGYLSVKELVALGRHPYTGFWGYLTKQDHEAVEAAIELTGVQHLTHKSVDQLSDGEHQKVMITRALAQQTDLLFLDEPTAHLDMVNRIGVFRLIKKLCKNHQKTILLSTHELDLALEVADKIILLQSDKDKAIVDTPEGIKSKGYIDQIFDVFPKD